MVQKFYICQHMRKLFYFIFIGVFLICLGCKDEQSKEQSEQEQFLQKVIGDDYQDKLSIPITESGEVDTANMAQIQFEQQIQRFDTIYAGDKITREFVFTNTGVKNLYITDSSTSCGCTVASYTKDGVPPGKQGKVVVNYDSKDRKGDEFKKVKIYSNTYPNETTIELKGFVIDTKKK